MALNDLLGCKHAHACLVPADPYAKLVQYLSEYKGTGYVACLKNGAPVAFVSPHLSKTELKFGVLTRLVFLVSWAVQHVQKYTTFATNIKVVVPMGEDALVVSNLTTHKQLCVQVVNVQKYVVRWIEGDNT